MSIEIRKMEPQDMNTALALLDDWSMAPLSPTPEIPDPERTALNIENSFVALDDGKLVGVASYIILGADTAETASLAVAKECRGLGVGYLLQKARLEEMKRKGIRTVRTETDRPETIDWYVRKFGYRIVGANKKKHSFSLPDVDFWTVLELDLTRL